MMTITNQAYVQPDEGYLMYKRTDAHRFPSGCVGIATNATYHRIWVDEWITEDKKKVGARINYGQYAVREFSFPKWNSTVATMRNGETATVVFDQKNCEIEVDTASVKALEATITGTTRKSTTVQLKALSTGTHTIYVRYKNSFVALKVEVE